MDVLFLIENKADIHVEDDYALRYVSYASHKHMVSLLLEHKADVRTIDDIFKFRLFEVTKKQ